MSSFSSTFPWRADSFACGAPGRPSAGAAGPQAPSAAGRLPGAAGREEESGGPGGSEQKAGRGRAAGPELPLPDPPPVFRLRTVPIHAPSRKSPNSEKLRISRVKCKTRFTYHTVFLLKTCPTSNLLLEGLGRASPSTNTATASAAAGKDTHAVHVSSKLRFRTPHSNVW